MFKEPVANITHITIFGDRNSGKSSLFNAIINQDIAIVDSYSGTTTDPVHKRIELIPFGPVLLTDTAGIDDDGALGEKRVEKTRKMYARTDFAIVLIDASSNKCYHECEKELQSYNIPYIRVFSKIDLVSNKELDKLKKQNTESLFVNSFDFESVLAFKDSLIDILDKKENDSIIGKYLAPKSHVVLVIPIDSEAPKGRLILPQVQVIRDLLDYNITVTITNELELKSVLKKHLDVVMVITDSQAFHKIMNDVDENIYLTSFSVLFAHYKSDLNNYNLELPNSIKKVLICESCTHNVGHEDIGMVKIPKLLKKRYGEIEINHVMGNDFVSNTFDYDLIVHCGSCMINSKVLKERMRLARAHNVPFINYGLYLAYEAGILSRSIKFFVDRKILAT